MMLASSSGRTRATYHRGPEWVKAAAVVALGLGAVVAWWARRARAFRVEVLGDSMAPVLRSGDVAVAVAVGAPRPGDVVVLEHPERPGLELVKRVVAVPGGLGSDARVLGPGVYWVEGDAPLRSSDSRHFGPVDIEGVRGRVVLVVWPPARVRVLRRAVRA